MIRVAAHHILSPLGASTAANFDAVRRGETAVRRWEGLWQLPQPFMASCFDDAAVDWLQPGYTRFESMAIASIRGAIAQWQQHVGEEKASVGSPRTVLILSTTKGNIALMGQEQGNNSRLWPGTTAATIAKAVGFTTEPIVIDNACISGVSAIILATRLLRMGLYDNAVVCGAEEQSRFIVSGFQSLKAMSPRGCQPFDIDRMGLNLGEAAATVVLTRIDDARLPWHVVAGAMRNDAHHLSAPSMTAEGAYRALSAVATGLSASQLAFISAHGTATMFNDQMEAVAIDRAGLSQVPVNAVKANYGHTMGACGVLETVLSMAAVDAGVVLPTKGFHELGVSKAIRITTSESTTAAKSFVKMVSGFGGGNAALLMSRDEQLDGDRPVKTVHHEVRHTLRLTPDSVTVDGKALDVNATGKAMLTELYKKEVGDYPKFYRMDLLSRVGFIAAELLVKAEEGNVGADSASRAVMLVGRSGSIQADLNYYQSICRPDDYFPSPERFVYTLPNIVAGEIAIRHRYHGETSFLLLSRRDDEAVTTILRSAFLDAETTSVLGGWIDCEDDSRFEAELSIIE